MLEALVREIRTLEGHIPVFPFCSFPDRKENTRGQAVTLSHEGENHRTRSQKNVHSLLMVTRERLCPFHVVRPCEFSPPRCLSRLERVLAENNSCLDLWLEQDIISAADKKFLTPREEGRMDSCTCRRSRKSPAPNSAEILFKPSHQCAVRRKTPGCKFCLDSLQTIAPVCCAASALTPRKLVFRACCQLKQSGQSESYCRHRCCHRPYRIQDTCPNWQQSSAALMLK